MSAFIEVIPVALPPGRLRLVTRPSSTGSAPTAKTIGVVEVAALAATAAGVLPGGGDHCHLPLDEVSSQCRQFIILSCCPPELDGNVLTFDKARFLQSFAVCSQAFGVSLC